MKKNMGSVDRVLRLIIAAVFVVLFATKVVTGTLGIVLLVLAAVFVATSILSVCPIYLLFRLSTAKKEVK